MLGTWAHGYPPLIGPIAVCKPAREKRIVLCYWTRYPSRIPSRSPQRHFAYSLGADECVIICNAAFHQVSDDANKS